MRRHIAALCAGALACCGAFAAEDGELTLGAGLHYSEGDYGTGTTTRITTLAATGRYDIGRWVYKALVPYLKVEGEPSVIPGFGRIRAPANRRTSESGLGDVVLSATYAAYYDAARTFGVDLTGKLKLATADEAKGLGTGEHDVAFLVDFYRTLDRVTAFGGVGYHILGDPPGTPLDNVWSANAGASYKLDERDSVGLMLEGRQRVSPDASPQRELTGFWVHKIDRVWKAHTYALIGLADGSPDWGLGVSLARPF